VIEGSYFVFDGFICVSTVFDTIVVGDQTQSLAQPIVHHVTVRNCTVGDSPSSGIVAFRCDYVTIENNYIYRCAFLGANQCSGISIFQMRNIDFAAGFHNFIRGNVCWGNFNKVPYVGQTGGATQVSDGNGIIVDDLRCVQNNTAGFPAYDAWTLVENNYCFDNGGRGIHSYLSDKVVFRRNTCFNNLLSANLPALNLPNSNGEFHTYQTTNIIFEENFAYRLADTTNCHCFHDGNTSSTNQFINNKYIGTIDLHASAFRSGMKSIARY
jgi:parallel beta-helix repeat protein